MIVEYAVVIIAQAEDRPTRVTVEGEEVTLLLDAVLHRAKQLNALGDYYGAEPYVDLHADLIKQIYGVSF
ncbi:MULTISPECIES: hypothetical protein [Streptomyces]|uniref:hypothetical protein n=1 Tax=Streptomyces TaxID=1883 RepID=UPI00345B96D8